ncbi:MULTISPECIES: ribosomal protein S18-alanine N-acetyltransferase [Thermodesulfovibrio]|jgi:ribosomal-protein-alanine N-acetyltransferase|uniref:ribosomal protein S18-alanine N-acetyltransferase n=1 Tax=Thermodesulfovibrio TaxID=28261 RepID=UPI00262519DE|nr:ribosomal protein S18-alanine N-acetyltransferase [Thermodesulfovibrio sp.]
MKIRAFQETDLPAILKIAEESFSLPWSLKSFQEEIASRISQLKVAELSGEVVGYVLYRTVTDEAEILSIAVKPEKRKKGIATALLKEALRDIEKTANVCFLEVRVSNKEAIGLYAKVGFKIAGLRKKYYLFPEEDAFVMEYPCKPSKRTENLL